MELLKNRNIIFSIALLFMGLNTYFIIKDNFIFSAFPIILLLLYIGLFHIRTAFLLVIFFTPLSINIEEFTDIDLGLFLPTEPLLFGLMLLAIFKQTLSPSLPKSFWKNPIVISVGFYLFWTLITTITSVLPIVSAKFLLMKLWYLIPIFFIGHNFFQEKSAIAKLLWSYTLSMTGVIIFTLIKHYGYSFAEREGHWVMFPFFKDHTIYGSSVVINLFFILGLLSYKRHKLYIYLVLILMTAITVIGLYFSYTRAAWLSVIFALGVWLLIRFRIKFRYLLVILLLIISVLVSSWHEIEIALSKNKYEHTTTNFEERIQSSANFTSDASNLERINRWEAAYLMYQEKPIFGFGPATYAFEYAPYQRPENLTIISTNFGDNGNAHSEFLGPLAEMGLIGMLAIIFFVTSLFTIGIKLLINLKRNFPEEKDLYYLILALVLANSSYFFHGLINNYLDTDKASIPIYCSAIIFIVFQQKFQKKKIADK
ncbi:MAG: O-antigen ligase family protein [Brumimicrobium sp.]|nr:O-antigen ligase family protein [Brumimicrobium sp.]MCO5268095.1 O-antigen ligase family protein [Brumimicrobium sp.]